MYSLLQKVANAKFLCLLGGEEVCSRKPLFNPQKLLKSYLTIYLNFILYDAEKKIISNEHYFIVEENSETQRSDPSFNTLSALTLVVKVLTLDWPSSYSLLIWKIF